MELDERSKYLRKLAIRCLKGGNRGHIGSTMSLIEIMRVLYDVVAKYNPREPKWKARDRIILSKGHGCIAQYVLLAEKTFFPIEELDRFCRPDGILGGHPSPDIPGIECHTGALGHGLSIAVGMALASRIRKETHRIFVIMGDGEINEGSVWEAAMSVSKHQLNNIIVIIDYNKIQSSGFVSDIQPLEPLRDKWKAFGFNVMEVNGHSCEDIEWALTRNSIKPICIIANTVKGKGISFAENDPMWHHKANFTNEQLQNITDAVI